MTSTKRQLPTNEDEEPPLKRPRADAPSATVYRNVHFNSCFSDEIVLSIFSHLTFRELCMVQEVDSRWARLAGDNSLWRRLFISDHPRQRLSGSRGFSPRWVTETGPSGREIKPLPARLRLKENQSHYWPFKLMYRISRNWRRGRCAVDHVPIDDADDSEREEIPAMDCAWSTTRLLLAGDIMIYASGRELVVRRTDSTSHSISFPRAITSLTLNHSAVDGPHSPPHVSGHHLSLVCFRADGAFSVHSISPEKPWQVVETHHAVLRGSQSPVRNAAYNYPLLAVLSSNFQLTIWDLGKRQGLVPGPEHVFSSYTCFSPSSMSLSVTGGMFKLLLAYTVPLYPRHWVPAISEVTLGREGNKVHVDGFRHAKPRIATLEWLSEDERRRTEEEWSRKLERVDTIQSDGKFLIVLAGDGLIQIYRVHYKPALRLSFLRSQYSRIDSIGTIKIADGRCVGTNRIGDIQVWDLEAGWDVTIEHNKGDSARSATRELAFDERRVVTLSSGVGQLTSWRFDS